MNAQHTENVHWLDQPVWKAFPKIRWETLLIIVILGLALFTRFYHLGDRVMSHDEVNHVVPSWELYMGRGYRHDPITHGPFQFHVVALSYFLFGDNDFTSRIPAALFSVATIMTVTLGFRRYLGRNGAHCGGTLFDLSLYAFLWPLHTERGFRGFLGRRHLTCSFEVSGEWEKALAIHSDCSNGLAICNKGNCLYLYGSIVAVPGDPVYVEKRSLSLAGSA